jgi:hypothetical protein
MKYGRSSGIRGVRDGSLAVRKVKNGPLIKTQLRYRYVSFKSMVVNLNWFPNGGLAPPPDLRTFPMLRMSKIPSIFGHPCQSKTKIYSWEN